jgi:Cdc6-like AAA superfamily ATPase
MYVSGPPGIGKTALLCSVIDELKQQVEERTLGEEVKVHMENCATVSAGGAQEGAWERLARGLGIEEKEGMERMKGKERFEEGIKDGRK